jgi:hypothetical protein
MESLTHDQLYRLKQELVSQTQQAKQALNQIATDTLNLQLCIKSLVYAEKARVLAARERAHQERLQRRA